MQVARVFSLGDAVFREPKPVNLLKPISFVSAGSCLLLLWLVSAPTRAIVKGSYNLYHSSVTRGRQVVNLFDLHLIGF